MRNRNFILFGTVAVLSFLLYLWVIRQPFSQTLIEWAQGNLLFYLGILIFLKTIAIVWPPLPGGLLTLGSIPVIGWPYAYAAEVIGGVLGASIAFYLGKRYGYWFLRKIFDQNVLAKIQKVKVAKKKEFEAIFILRLFTGVISEAVSYGSGMIGARYKNFFFATLCASLLNLPLFYFANNIFTGRNVLLNILLVLVFGAFFWKFKGRYFE